MVGRPMRKVFCQGHTRAGLRVGLKIPCKMKGYPLSDGKTYIVNDTFLKAEKTYDSQTSAISTPKIAKHLASDSQTLATLVEDNMYNNIGKIVKSFAGDREKILDELSKLPIAELKEDKTNVYLCKLAIQRKEDNERESKATYVNSEKILTALSRIKKQANPRYREKVEYNKRNNLNWKGEPNK